MYDQEEKIPFTILAKVQILSHTIETNQVQMCITKHKQMTGKKVLRQVPRYLGIYYGSDFDL